jgi:hypothetical protein
VCRSNDEIDHITLAASNEGTPLYELLGFETDGMAMKLRRAPVQAGTCGSTRP